jgi:hypothetical protein
MSLRVGVESANQQVTWRYRRDMDLEMVITELDLVLDRLDGQPFTFMTDLRQIRYILPEDRQIIDRVYEFLKLTHVLDSVYLVDFRNYHRMRLLIHLNHFPNPDMIFKYEADANDYLSMIVLKQRKQWSQTASTMVH